MKYVPRKPPQPVTATYVSKDFHAPKGTYVVITETGALRCISAQEFKETYAPVGEVSPATPASKAPPSPRKSSPRYPYTDPRSHVQIAARMFEGVAPDDRSLRAREVREKFPTLNVGARVHDAKRLGVLIERDGVYARGPKFAPLIDLPD